MKIITHCFYFFFEYTRITPQLLKACRTNLVDFCGIPQDWTMRKEMDDVQIGQYLSCLHRQRSEVKENTR